MGEKAHRDLKPERLMGHITEGWVFQTTGDKMKCCFEKAYNIVITMNIALRYRISNVKFFSKRQEPENQAGYSNYQAVIRKLEKAFLNHSSENSQSYVAHERCY